MRQSTFSVQVLSLILLVMAIGLLSGCRIFSTTPYSAATETQVPNPLTVPPYDRTLVMDEISDELDDYFKIYKDPY